MKLLFPAPICREVLEHVDGTSAWNMRVLVAEDDPVLRHRLHAALINDKHGHLAGDDVLRETARRLRATFRRGDAVGRYGGEEFVALALGCSMGDALGLAERFRENISCEPVATSAGLIDITTSVGVAVFPNVDTSWTLLKAADEALYRAKASGRNTVAHAA